MPSEESNQSTVCMQTLLVLEKAQDVDPTVNPIYKGGNSGRSDVPTQPGRGPQLGFTCSLCCWGAGRVGSWVVSS